MSDNQLPPPGWFPDPQDASRQRWWDGTQWTEHRAPAVAAQPATQQGLRPATPYIWVLVALPVLTLIGVLAWNIDRYLTISLSPSLMEENPLAAYDGSYLLLIGLALLAYVLAVVMAVLDYRALRVRGVQRPFHWAWVFFGGLIYIIGRSVIVRRRTGAGLAPLWLYIGLYVVVTIVTFVKVGGAIARSIPFS